MRTIVISVWIFINLLFFGMCGYMYLLWSQYWMYIYKEIEPTGSNYDQEINNYNRARTLVNTSKLNEHSESKRIKHSIKENVTYIKNSKPRFPNVQTEYFPIDSKKYTCVTNDSTNECDIKTLGYKERILKELQRVFSEESDVFKSGGDNRYNVHYKGTTGNYMNKDSQKLLCELKKVQLLTLKKSDVSFNLRELRDHLPRRNIFENKNFNTCAVVTSAGSFRDSNLGKLIDSHDVVLRFNHAPTQDFEKDVGNKTTVRILNSQVVSKKEFDFLRSDLYRNVTLLAWDPVNYTATLGEWFQSPEFDLFPNYVQYRKLVRKPRLYLLHPQTLWRLWDFLQSNSPSRLRRNPPSSGFLGLFVLLPFCNSVDVFEYVPSTRVTKRCHYYDSELNAACTFGVWHPLAAEKLITYRMNDADDRSVFQTGYVRIAGFRRVSC